MSRRDALNSNGLARVLDARPDTMDFRDRMYEATLVEVPPRIDLALGGPRPTAPAGAGFKGEGTASASAAPSFSKSEGATDLESLKAHGAEVYANVCQACHQADGKGLPGAFPPLAGSSGFYGTPEKHAGIIVHGLSGAITVQGTAWNGAMPWSKQRACGRGYLASPTTC